MTKNNKILRTLSLLLCFALMLAGCGGDKPEETTVPGAELAGIYKSDLSVEGGMSVEMYLQIGEDGSFVFARSNDFASKEKGAGLIAKDAEGRDIFDYEIVRDEPVEKGTHVAAFELTAEGGIRFTSKMWFGSATPRLGSDEEGWTYPLFLPYDESAEATEASSAVTEPSEETTAPSESEETTEATEETEKQDSGSKETRPKATEPKATEPKATEPKATEPKATEPKATEPKATEPKPTDPPKTEPPETEPAPTDPPKPSFKEGTYTGSADKHVDAMDSDIHYDITLKLSGGSYTYTVEITLSGGMSHSETQTYTGSYSVDGMNLSMTGTLKSAVAREDGSLHVTGKLSSFAGSSDTVTLYR